MAVSDDDDDDDDVRLVSEITASTKYLDTETSVITWHPKQLIITSSRHVIGAVIISLSVNSNKYSR